MIKILPKYHEDKIGRFFFAVEFICPCANLDCDFTLLSSVLVEKLDLLREKLGTALMITSGFRCSRRNKSVGGTTLSRHLAGLAADIAIPDGVEPSQIEAAIVEIGFSCYYFNLAKKFFHVDVRGLD